MANLGRGDDGGDGGVPIPLPSVRGKEVDVGHLLHHPARGAQLRPKSQLLSNIRTINAHDGDKVQPSFIMHFDEVESQVPQLGDLKLMVARRSKRL